MAVQMGVAGAVLLGSDFKAIGVARSLGRRGVPSVVVDALPRAAWFSRYVVDRLRWRGPMDGPAFVDYLLQAGKQRELEGWAISPTADEVVEVVAWHCRNLVAVCRPAT
jgi:predicted ATP-grasp superfamily ATP-dependent carboligase